MKHGAHIVKMFTERSINVLKQNNVNIHKIIEFMDQAPSQYKNKTPFNYLADCDIPIQKNYFGVRHGKSLCDACTGRVKQGVTALVKSGQAVVDILFTVPVLNTYKSLWKHATNASITC